MPIPKGGAFAAPNRRRFQLAGLLALLLALIGLVPISSTAPATAAPPTKAPSFGANVTIFDPSMDVADIQSALDKAANEQVDAEMGTARYAFYFLPGTYGTESQPLQVRIGYNTEVSGLGVSPTDVVIKGKVEAYNRCIGAGGSNCIALNNFWRTLSNLTISVNAGGQDGCRATANFWAVSQAVSMRRVKITDGNLSLMDYCTAGPQYASGGFIADSQLPAVTNGSQQQWYIRNSSVESWSNAVWNQVFSGVTGAPSDTDFPDPPYTTLDTTPLSREKPYLFVDEAGQYQVRVPTAATNTSGVSWANQVTPGRSIPLTDFYLAKPSDSAKAINQQLARGKNLLFTPGVYDIDRSIEVRRANTVVLGMGQATLTAVKGATPMRIADVPGVIVAGLTFDAGTVKSNSLLEVGRRHARRSAKKSNPTTLSDVYFRVGGPHIGKTKVALVVNSDRVLIDHTWVWRADHGVEGFTNGVNGDTDRWNTNTAKNGVIVNGDHVTATGFFVEHFQGHNVIWNGNGGTVVLFQSELAYDAPTQADWQQPDGTLGWASYKVGARVKTHQLYGGGAYVFQQNNPEIHTENGFVVPEWDGVKLHHILTVNLDGGVIDHVVNGVGDAVTTDAIGVPEYVSDYPNP